MRHSYYDKPEYRNKQSKIARRNHRKGIYKHLNKHEKRECARKECQEVFMVARHDFKKYCSRSCAAKVNNSKRAPGSLSKKNLEKLYWKDKLSQQAIANQLGVSLRRVVYWMQKYSISTRSRSEATYVYKNPAGDPFQLNKPETLDDAFLFGLGVGLFWGEGHRKSSQAVRLGNSDPEVIKVFIKFLEEMFSVSKTKLKFGLQIFGDMPKDKVFKFWLEELEVDPSQFYKITVTPHRGVGNYKKKTRYGVLTVSFDNTKLKKCFDKLISDPSLPG